MTPGTWWLHRMLPTTLLALVIGVVVGFLRTVLGFMVGFQGMLVGGLAGYAAGRIGRHDDDRHWSCSRRLIVLAVVSAIILTSQIAIVAVTYSGPDESPWHWFIGLLDDYHGEPIFAAHSDTARNDSHAGGIGWFFLQIVDLGLFAFLFVISHGVALDCDNRPKKPKPNAPAN